MIVQQILNSTPTFVINLTERKDKRKAIKHHLDKKNIRFQFFDAQRHPTSPKRGCLESHLTIIKRCINENKERVFIMEDDANYISHTSHLKRAPSDWDMLYFGGTVFRVLDKSHQGWTRVQTWTTHSYMINLRNRELVEDLLKLETYDGEIDRYYLEFIHPKYKCYMADPMICIQRGGFSDIEGKEVDYSFMTQTLRGLTVPESGVDADGNYVLRLPEIPFENLPYVSIITPTYKRQTLFAMALYNVFGFYYPKEKIEWIIVEDMTDDMTIEETVKGLLPPGDQRIKHILLESGSEPYTIAMKRNIGVSNASHRYIVHVDDDDIYEEHTLLARVKLLLKYESQGIQCLGSTMIGTYNIVNNTSSMASDGPISLSEASMAYTREFWDEKKFDDNCIRGEHKSFTEGRLHKILDVPFAFTVIALIHKKNFTNQIREELGENSKTTGLLRYSDKARDGREGEVANFLDTFPEERQMFMLDLRDEIMKN